MIYRASDGDRGPEAVKIRPAQAVGVMLSHSGTGRPLAHHKLRVPPCKLERNQRDTERGRHHHSLAE